MRASRHVALVVALFAAAASAHAANPYKSKKHLAQLPADVGMDATRLHDTRQAYCGLFDPALVTKYRELNETIFHDCLVIEVDEGFAFFSYDDEAKKWKSERVLRPDNVVGARLVESGKRSVKRQLQFELPNGIIFVFSYAGGVLGDNTRPLETIKVVEQLGFKPIEGVSSILPKLDDKPITITIRR